MMSSQAKPLSMKHLMTPAPHSIGRNQPLMQAHRMMHQHGIRHLPVLEQGKLVGILSERDLFFLETIASVDLEKTHVDEGMSQDVYCVGTDAELAEVVTNMAKHKYGCAVVVDRGHVVGMFTTTDALTVFAERLRGQA